MSRSGLIAALGGLVLALGVAACGGDDDDGQGDVPEPAATQAVSGEGDTRKPGPGDDANDQDDPSEDGTPSEVPSTGTDAAPAKRVKACLQKQGFQVSIESAIPDDVRQATGIESTLAVLGGSNAPGAGSITYYETLEQAVAGAKVNDEQTVPNTVLGRTERATYTFTGEGLEEAGRAIRGCL